MKMHAWRKSCCLIEYNFPGLSSTSCFSNARSDFNLAWVMYCVDIFTWHNSRMCKRMSSIAWDTVGHKSSMPLTLVDNTVVDTQFCSEDMGVVPTGQELHIQDCSSKPARIKVMQWSQLKMIRTACIITEHDSESFASRPLVPHPSRS